MPAAARRRIVDSGCNPSTAAPTRVNRIARGAAMIENLSVSLLGGIQPDPIRKIADDTVDDGLLQRLIPIVLRRGKPAKMRRPAKLGQRYDELIEQLHERLASGSAICNSMMPRWRSARSWNKSTST